ncbi:MAG: hypothetical protein H7Z72_08340 [Bacteroidetes bacterium]|nr:hypothetical protein [Fibrella sp.]
MKIERKTIPDIYNFCDSWCERCLFTQRCQSYQVQVENGLNQPIDHNVTLLQQVTEAVALTKKYLERIRATNAPTGLLPTDLQALEQQTLPVAPTRHPVAELGHDYLRQTGDWLRNEKGLLQLAGYQQMHEVKLGIRTEDEALHQLNALKDAWEMIKWYRTLIPVKTVAALRLFDAPTGDAKLTDYYVGKAKLVLVCIDRSMLAWQTVMTGYPEKIDELLDVLALLNRIGRELETLFPGARAFKRPGLD